MLDLRYVNALSNVAHAHVGPDSEESTHVQRTDIRAIESSGYPGPEAFREAVLERLAAHALKSGGAAHDINNPCASVTANLSYLALRAEDLAAQSETVQDETVKARIREIYEELKEITEESSDAMKRIAAIARGLGQPKLRLVASEEEPATLDLAEIAGRATRLVSQCTAAEIQLEFSGDPARVAIPHDLAAELILDLIVAALEDGNGDSSGAPVAVLVNTDTKNAHPVLSVTRRGQSQRCPSIHTILKKSSALSQRFGGALSVQSDGSGQYTIEARFAARPSLLPV